MLSGNTVVFFEDVSQWSGEQVWASGFFKLKSRTRRIQNQSYLTSSHWKSHNQAAQAAKCHHQLLNKPRFQKTTWTSLGGDQCARKTSHDVQTFQLKLAENKFQVVTIWHAVLKRSNDQGFLIGNMVYTSWNGEMRVYPQPNLNTLRRYQQGIESLWILPILLHTKRQYVINVIMVYMI